MHECLDLQAYTLTTNACMMHQALTPRHDCTVVQRFVRADTGRLCLVRSSFYMLLFYTRVQLRLIHRLSCWPEVVTAC